MDQHQPPTQRLADALLPEGESLEDFVSSRRLAGISWRLIARDLWEATGRRIDVTPQTLKNWFLGADRTGWIKNSAGAA